MELLMSVSTTHERPTKRPESKTMTFKEKAAKTSCRSCGHVGLEPVLDLGVTALVDTLVLKENLNKHENKYPLQVGLCP